jgi:hypothetical protein
MLGARGTEHVTFVLIFGAAASLLAVIILGTVMIRSSLRKRTELRQMEDLKRWAEKKSEWEKAEDIWRKNRDLDMR